MYFLGWKLIFWLKFYDCLLLVACWIINQHCARQWLGYLKQGWPLPSIPQGMHREKWSNVYMLLIDLTCVQRTVYEVQVWLSFPVKRASISWAFSTCLAWSTKYGYDSCQDHVLPNLSMWIVDICWLSSLKLKYIHFDKISSLAAPEVVILATIGVTSDDNLVKMTFPCQWGFWKNWPCYHETRL